MKKVSFVVILVCFMVCFSCKKYDANGHEIKYPDLYKANWLLGEWQKKDSIGNLVEIWQPLNDSSYSGKSYYIKNKKDTIHFETIELIQNKNDLIYSTTITGQNNDEVIPFKLTKDSDSLLVFENPKKDYPQKITYKLLKNKSIMATISGKQNGKNSSESYPMDAVK